MSMEMIVFLSFLSSAIYMYIGKRLNTVMHPMRMELIEKAERLLNYSDLREDDRNGINGALDRVYSYRSAWGLSIGVLLVSLVQGVRYLFGHRRQPISRVPHSREITDFVRLAVPCILANSLAATILFSIILVFGILCLLPVRSAARFVTLAGHDPIHGPRNDTSETHC
jgi:hypothetical protein